MEEAHGQNKDLIRRRKSFAQRRSLSEYAVSLPSQPEDVSGVHPKDDRFKFFSKGRDFQSHKAKHRFTDDEKRVLETYESSAVLPSHTTVYTEWLESCPQRNESESWILITIIAVIVGTLAFIMKEICEKLQIFSNSFILDYVDRGQTLRLWMYYCGMSCTFTAFSALIVVYFCPYAAGSGLPEIIGVLNGVVVRNVLSVKTLVSKIVSCVFTVISGLPVGYEGPMIHIGAMVGALMARPLNLSSCCPHERKEYKSGKQAGKQSFWTLPHLCRYRDCQERYSLICVGAAAGVSSAFSSPITGLCFSMEEMSSHWSNTLSWQTFVCCILSRSMTEILRSVVGSLGSHESGETFGFELSESPMFDAKQNLNLTLKVFFPTIVIGLIGGISGSLFIFMHLKVSKCRRKLLGKISRAELLNMIKVIEAVFIAFLCSGIIVGTMPFNSCAAINHTQQFVTQHEGKFLQLHSFQCDLPLRIEYKEHRVIQTGQYHQGATLLFGSWEQMLRNLYTRKTADLFGVPVLSLVLVFFFIFSSWTSMSYISNGLLIPQFAIGALYGRILGRSMHELFSLNEGDSDDWFDPGAMAVLGSASFMSGTSRLPITSVVIMIEMTNDINMSLLIMIVVMLSKFVGDLFTHSLYHSILELKCIPHLESELKIYRKKNIQNTSWLESKMQKLRSCFSAYDRVNLELFQAADVMASPVEYVKVTESVQNLATLLITTNHGAFPVVESVSGLMKTFLGLITRLELTILLTRTATFDSNDLNGEDIARIQISYPEYSSSKLKDTVATNAILNNYVLDLRYQNIFVNLLPYINTSTNSVTKVFSLYRTYMLFRKLGLRHLVVTDLNNQLEGIITRKNLMGFAVESKIKKILAKRQTNSSRTLQRSEEPTRLRPISDSGNEEEPEVSRNII